jgi:hypothetical protein
MDHLKTDEDPGRQTFCQLFNNCKVLHYTDAEDENKDTGTVFNLSLSLSPWHYSPDGRKPPLIRFHSLIQCICGASG